MTSLFHRVFRSKSGKCSLNSRLKTPLSGTKMIYATKPNGAPNQSLEPTLLSRILLRLLSPLQHCKSSLVTLRQPQGGSAPPLGGRTMTQGKGGH